MKLRSMAMVMFGVGALVAGGGCKKKPKEGKAPEIGSASDTMGSAGSGSAAAEAPKEAKLEGKALADRYLECTGYINEAKWDDFKTKCLSADYKAHQADGEDAGLDETMEWFKNQHAAFPDMKLQPQIVLVNGRNIFSVSLITGTHTGTLKGAMGEVPATNKKIGQLMFHRLTINDENRANQEWAYFDPHTLAYQLGLTPKEAPKMRDAMDKGIIEGAPVIVVAADDAKEKANLEAWQKSQAAFQSKKTADYMAYYTDDAVESDQAGDKDMKGKKEIEAGSQIFLKAFPDVKIETPDVFAAGDYIVALGTFSGTNTGPLGPMKATKKPVKGEFAEVVKMKDGKIAGLWRFRNGISMAIQLGLMDAPAATPAGSGSGSAAPAAGSGSAAAAKP